MMSLWRGDGDPIRGRVHAALPVGDPESWAIRPCVVFSSAGRTGVLLSLNDQSGIDILLKMIILLSDPAADYQAGQHLASDESGSMSGTMLQVGAGNQLM